MDRQGLLDAIQHAGLTIPSYSAAIGISKKTGYAKVNGESEFTREEISKSKRVLDLSENGLLAIFFADVVS